MSFKPNTPFDRSPRRNGAVVGQYLTRGSQAPEIRTETPTESAAMHLLRLAHEEANRLLPPQPGQRPNPAAQPGDLPAMENLRQAIAEARRAMPRRWHSRSCARSSARKGCRPARLSALPMAIRPASSSCIRSRPSCARRPTGR